MLDFGVEAKKVMAFIHDNGANIDLAARTVAAKQGWYSPSFREINAAVE